jgi:hypothetical protein
VYNGVGYIGVVSDAISTQSRADLRGYILSFNPNNIALGFTTALTINFNSYGNTNLNGALNTNMKPWVATYAQAIAQTGIAGPAGPQQCPQPIISSIEFNEDGSMDIGIRDRWGDQSATYEFTPVAASTTHQQIVIGGDILHACKVGAGWILEGTVGSCDQPAANVNSVSLSSNFGQGASFQNTGKEWYADRAGDGQSENNEAGMAKLMGTENLVTTVFDPMPPNTTLPAGFVYLSTQGLQWNNIVTGSKTQWARTQGENSGLDKCNGLGDLEFLTNPQPIQIGNRIWDDLDGDGIQDANETTSPVPAGTTVTLRSPGVDGTYGNGDDQTWTTATNAAGNYYFDNTNVLTVDNRRPTEWLAVSGILPGYNYRVEVPIPLVYTVTVKDNDINGLNNIDNDATAIGYTAIAYINTNYIVHNYDIGLVQVSLLPTRILFEAIKIKNDAKLQWGLSSDENIARFELEHSLNNKDFFIINGQVKNSLKSYQYIHDISLNGPHYYRVKMIDNNGRSSYSEIKMIQFEAKESLYIFPNPASESINLQIPSHWQGKQLMLQIHSQNGQLLLNRRLLFASPIEKIDVENLSTGIFIVSLINETGEIQRRKITKLK